MSVSSLGTPPPEPALVTPHINDEESSILEGDITMEQSSSEKKRSVFDIAKSMEEKLSDLSEILEKHDKEMNDILDGIQKRVQTLEEKERSNDQR